MTTPRSLYWDARHAWWGFREHLFVREVGRRMKGIGTLYVHQYEGEGPQWVIEGEYDWADGHNEDPAFRDRLRLMDHSHVEGPPRKLLYRTYTRGPLVWGVKLWQKIKR